MMPISRAFLFASAACVYLLSQSRVDCDSIFKPIIRIGKVHIGNRSNKQIIGVSVVHTYGLSYEDKFTNDRLLNDGDNTTEFSVRYRTGVMTVAGLDKWFVTWTTKEGELCTSQPGFLGKVLKSLKKHVALVQKLIDVLARVVATKIVPQGLVDDCAYLLANMVTLLLNGYNEKIEFKGHTLHAEDERNNEILIGSDGRLIFASNSHITSTEYKCEKRRAISNVKDALTDENVAYGTPNNVD